MHTMRSPLAQRRLLVLFIILLLFAQSATMPFRHTFRFSCVLSPVTVWKLRYDGSGQITGVWQKSALTEEVHYALFQFDRPDIADIRLCAGLHDGGMVHKGDVLGWVSSRELGHTLKITEAELVKAEAAEAALKAGARSADIGVEQANLAAADAILNAFEPEYQRTCRLFDDSLVSQAARQQAEGKRQVLTADRDLAAAKVHALSVGGREEDVSVAAAEVRRLEQAVRRGQDLLGKEEPVIAPFDGILRLGGERDVLFSLARTDTLDATFVMPETYAPLLKPGTTACLHLFALPDTLFDAAIMTIQHQGADSAGLQAHAYLPNPGASLTGGMIGFGEIRSEPMTMLHSLRLRMGRMKQMWTM
jgi:hypothetical protein